jgi:hypothetical protein
MLTIALLVLSQATVPVLPAGSRADFHRELLAVQALTTDGKFAEAERRLAALPVAKGTFSWDDSAVPADSRAAFRTVRDQALEVWKTFAPEAALTESPSGSLRFSFAPTGPVRLERAAGFTRALLPLQKGNPAKPITALDVSADFNRALALYFGVADNPLAGTAMNASNHPATGRYLIMRQEFDTVNGNLRTLAELRRAVATKTPVPAAAPKITLARTDYDLGKMLQGQIKELAYDISNSGNAQAQMWLRPDCGCVVADGQVTLEPGETRNIRFTFNGEQFDGDVLKKLIFFTNDPDNPIQMITLRAHVEPMFRFLVPGGNVAVLGEGSQTIEVYLTFKESEPFRIRRVDLNGLPGEVDYEAWEGELPDPERDEPTTKRRGYKFTIVLSGAVPPGRVPATLNLLTDSPTFPTVRHNIFAQRGIVALPDDLFVGEIGRSAQVFKVLISRPGKPFRVLSVGGVPNISARIDSTKSAQEHAVELLYDGRAQPGAFERTVVVKTDDPGQPEVLVRIRGSVR